MIKKIKIKSNKLKPRLKGIKATTKKNLIRTKRKENHWNP